MTSETCRYICAAIVVVALFIWRSRITGWRRRASWILLLTVGVANVFLILGRREVHSNLAYYYLGAKYPVPYFEFFRCYMAAREEPFVSYRDLEHPGQVIAHDPRAQRLYFMDVLERNGIACDVALTTTELRSLAETHELFKKEGDALLHRFLDDDRIAQFKQDVRYPIAYYHDFGFNGSPLYSALRRLDPTLHQPMGPNVARLNIVVQLLALIPFFLLVRRALGWTADETWLIAVLLLASWDFSGWTLTGLIGAGWMLPVAVALWAMHAQKHFVVGLAVAWATLIKLFPFILLAPIGISLLRKLWGVRATGRLPLLKNEIAVLASFVVGLLAFGSLGLLSGYSWTGFLGKILSEFHESYFIGNGVGIASLFIAAGQWESAAFPLIQLAWFVAVVVLLWRTRPDEASGGTAWGAVVVLASLGFATRTWFSYYAVIALLLWPALARQHRGVASLLLVLLALNNSLPDFGGYYMGSTRPMVLFKTMPWLALAWWGLASLARTRLAGLHAAATLAVVAVFLLGWRVPTNPPTAMRRADDASDRAIELAQAGQNSEALGYFQEASGLVPHDERHRFNLANALIASGDWAGARTNLETALRIKPDFSEAKVLLEKLQKEPSNR